MSAGPARAAAPAAESPAPDLDRSFLRSLAWSGAGRWLTQAISWPATIIIARQLSPNDYGMVVLVRVYTDFLARLTEAGLGLAVTMAPEMDDRRAGQLHTVSLLLGVVALVVACALAYPLSAFYKRPGLELVVFALSVGFVIDAAGVVPNGLLRREFGYKTIAAADWARSLVDVAVELTLAFLGFGYWTLVCGHLAGGVAWQSVVLTRRRLRFRWPRLAEVRDTLRAMGHMSTQGFAGFVTNNSDVMIAGRLASNAAVGAYNFAGQLAAIPSNKVIGIVANVTPSLFREVAGDHALFRRYVLVITEVLTAVVLPAFIGIALVASDFAAVVLGSKWSGMVVPLRFLAVNAALQAMFMVHPQILWATQRGRVESRFMLFGLAVFPPLFLTLGWLYGINGLAAAWVIGTPIVGLARARVAHRAIGLPTRAYLQSIWPAASSGALMAAAVLALQWLARDAALPTAARLALSVAGGGVVYGSALLLLHGARVRSAVSAFRALRK